MSIVLVGWGWKERKRRGYPIAFELNSREKTAAPHQAESIQSSTQRKKALRSLGERKIMSAGKKEGGIRGFGCFLRVGGNISYQAHLSKSGAGNSLFRKRGEVRMKKKGLVFTVSVKKRGTEENGARQSGLIETSLPEERARGGEEYHLASGMRSEEAKGHGENFGVPIRGGDTSPGEKLQGKGLPFIKR